MYLTKILHTIVIDITIAYSRFANDVRECIYLSSKVEFYTTFSHAGIMSDTINLR